MPADYNIPMTDAQITEALQLMVERVSEGWAQGTYDGSPVGSGSPYYQNNSKYWATQAIDAAARAEAAVPAGTAGAVFFDRAQSLTDAQKEQAKANISAGRTNPNLLMNPWFTVNQRGITALSFTSIVYSVDRWKVQATAGTGTMTPSADGIKLERSVSTGQTYLIQILETPGELNGRILTASLMLKNGTIYKGTITRVNGTQQDFFYNQSGYTFRFTPSNQIYISMNSTSAEIRAVKLEYGSVSTIANDGPPDYSQELAKCQRYYNEYLNNLTGGLTLLGSISSTTTTADFVLPLPVPIRATPTVTLTGGATLFSPAGQYVAVSSISVVGMMNNLLYLRAASTGLTAGTDYRLALNSASKLSVSADL